MSSQTFRKQHKLLTASDFSTVFQKPDCRHLGRNFIWLAKRRTSATLPSRLGLVVSKKSLPLSVHRQALKRKVRETFRRASLPTGWDLIFRSLPQFDKKAFKTALQKKDNGYWNIQLQSSWRKLEKKVLSSTSLLPGQAS